MNTANLLQAVETRREVSAVDRAIENILANGMKAAIAADKRKAVIAMDGRHARLAAVAATSAPAPITGDGMIGGMQVFASLARPEQGIHLRATYLALARIAQIDGNHARVRMMLRKARSFRSAK